MKTRYPLAAVWVGLSVFSGCAPVGGPPEPPPAWIVQASGTRASLRGLSAVDDRIAWASGTEGTVLRTVDGGATWTAAPVAGAEEVDFRDIEAFSAETAIAMGIGEPARIFRTEDGGRTWVRTYLDETPGVFLDSMAFFDERNGLAAGDPLDGRFYLVRTDDGGKSWAPLPPESRPLALEGEAAFAASGTALFVRDDRVNIALPSHQKLNVVRDDRVYIALPSHQKLNVVRDDRRAWLGTGGSVSRILRSEDGGVHWEDAPSALGNGTPSSGAFSVYFFDANCGAAVGGDYRNEAADGGNAAVSDDGGKTWTPLAGRRPGGFREAVAAAPGASDVVAVGPSGSDYSPDRGRTWIPIAGPAGFHTISFARAGRTAWAAGRDGLIARLRLR